STIAASVGRDNDLAFSGEAGAPSCRSSVPRSRRGGQRSCPSARQLPAERSTEPGFVRCNALLDSPPPSKPSVTNTLFGGSAAEVSKGVERLDHAPASGVLPDEVTGAFCARRILRVEDLHECVCEFQGLRQ